MVAMIRGPEKGGNSGGRLVENITGHPPADGLLADMLLTNDQAKREALAKKAAAAIGHAAAAGRPIVSLTGINVAAARSGAPFRGGFADELHHLSSKEMRKAQAERSAQAIERVKTRIDYCKANSPCNLDALEHCLEYGVEDDLGRFSDADYKAAIPGLVEYAGIGGERAERLIRHLQMLGKIGRRDREAEAQYDHQAEWNDRAASRRERKQAGLSCFATYAINPQTSRAVADEEFEAAEIARAQAEAAKAATRSGAGNIAFAVKKGADLGSILVEVFVAACHTRNLPIDVESMIASFVEASGDTGLAGIFERTTAAARDCTGPADTEAAFSRLLAAEGVASPFTFAPEAPAEPVAALVEIKAPSAPVEVPEAAAAVPDDEAERRLIAQAVDYIKAKPADLFAVVRQVSRTTTLISVEALTGLMIAASREVTRFMHDAFRLSVEQAREAAFRYDDAEVESRVDKLLAAIHAPITGEPGDVERSAREVVAAMSPTGATGPTPFAWRDPHTLPRRQWLYGTLYIRKELTATISPGGVGKTALTIVEALALASGRDLLGIQPTKRCKVWIWSGEEPIEELQKRILAACEHHGLTARDIEGWLFVDNFETFDFIIAEQTRDGTTVFQPRVDLLIRWLINNKIDVLFIDPAISTHNVGENDNVAIQKWATGWKSVAVGANASVSIAHHAKKLGEQAATADDSRGARSFVDKCRIVRSLAPMSEADAGRFQLPEEDRRYFFFVDPTKSKANMSPAVGGREWFRSHSVVLGKGYLGKYDPGEPVGVVDHWTPPKTTDKLDGETVAAIREAVGGRRWRAANNQRQQADNIYAPIAQALVLDPESPSDMRRIKATHERLLKEGWIIEEKVPADDGKSKPFARWRDED